MSLPDKDMGFPWLVSGAENARTAAVTNSAGMSFLHRVLHPAADCDIRLLPKDTLQLGGRDGFTINPVVYTLRHGMSVKRCRQLLAQTCYSVAAYIPIVTPLLPGRERVWVRGG